MNVPVSSLCLNMSINFLEMLSYAYVNVRAYMQKDSTKHIVIFYNLQKIFTILQFVLPKSEEGFQMLW